MLLDLTSHDGSGVTVDTDKISALQDFDWRAQEDNARNPNPELPESMQAAANWRGNPLMSSGRTSVFFIGSLSMSMLVREDRHQIKALWIEGLANGAEMLGDVFRKPGEPK